MIPSFDPIGYKIIDARKEAEKMKLEVIEERLKHLALEVKALKEKMANDKYTVTLNYGRDCYSFWNTDIPASPEKESWEPPGGEFWIATNGVAYDCAVRGGAFSTNGSRVYGSEWNTMRKAKIAAKKVQIFQWLLHMADEWGLEETDVSQIFKGLHSAAFNGAKYNENRDKTKNILDPLLEELRELMR